MKELRSRKKHPPCKKGVRQYLAAFLSVCLIWVLVGCSSGSEPNTGTGEPTGDSYFENENSPDDNKYGKVYSKSEASSRGGLYVKRGDDFFALDYALAANSFYSEMFENAIVDYDTSRNSPYTEAPVLQMDIGDELVTFTAKNSNELYPVEDRGYCFPAELNWSSGRIEFVPMFNSGWEDSIIDGRRVEEVNGMTYSSEDELVSILGQRGCGIYSFSKYAFTNDYIFSYEPSTVTCGYYSGTDYIERDLPVNVPLYVLDNAIELPVIKGKEGYFTVDLSQLSTLDLSQLSPDSRTILCLIKDTSYDMGSSTGGLLMLKIFCS